jgi:hypothetical protein
MIVHFVKAKTNKTEGSLKNIWIVSYIIHRQIHPTGAGPLIEKTLAHIVEAKIKERFPDSFTCMTNITEGIFTSQKCELHISLSDADEAYFIMWTNAGIEV